MRRLFAMFAFGLGFAASAFAAKKEEPTKRGRRPKQEAGRSVEGTQAPPPRQQPAAGEADVLDTLEALKPLIAQHGADKLKRLVDLLG